MFKWLKKHFIPHEGNDHQPHFLRIKNIRTLIVIVFLMELGVLGLPFLPALNLSNNSYLASVLPAVLDDLTNQNRQSQHLAVLTVSPVLNKVAEMKAKDMAEKGYFAHVSPEGKQPWYWFNLAGYNYEYAGENLAVDFTDSQDVSVAWMNSPAHRANIVKNTYTEMGTGIANGTYEGKSTIFVAQVFGKPAGKNVVEETPVITKVIPAPEASTTKVMGASTKAIVKTFSTSTATVTPIVSSVAKIDAPVQTYSKTNIFQKFATSPRHIVNIVFVILVALVGLALFLKLVIRADKKHPVLITNGLVVLVFIFGVYTVNNYVAKSKTAVTTSFASFHGEQIDQIK
jgi:hypothetical protein